MSNYTQDTYRCALCGIVLTETEVEIQRINNQPGACLSDLQNVLDAARFRIEMWPSSWYGHWYLNRDNQWFYDVPDYSEYESFD